MRCYHRWQYPCIIDSLAGNNYGDLQMFSTSRYHARDEIRSICRLARPRFSAVFHQLVSAGLCQASGNRGGRHQRLLSHRRSLVFGLGRIGPGLADNYFGNCRRATCRPFQSPQCDTMHIFAERGFGRRIGLWRRYLHGPVWWMYIFLGLGAIGYALGGASRSSILPQIVSTEIFSNAITWNTTIFHIASMTGPAMGGLIVGWEKTAVAAFAFVMILRMFSLIAMAFIQKPPSVGADGNHILGKRFGRHSLCLEDKTDFGHNHAGYVRRAVGRIYLSFAGVCQRYFAGRRSLGGLSSGDRGRWRGMCSRM